MREGLEKSFFDDAKITDERVAYYYRPLRTRGGQLAALRARTQADQFPIGQDLGRTAGIAYLGAQDVLIRGGMST